MTKQRTQAEVPGGTPVEQPVGRLPPGARKTMHRYNYREAAGFDDVQRAREVLKAIAGKRLTYRA